MPVPTDPTADYRKYPKGPNFGLIVALACAALLIVLIAAYFLVRSHGTKMIPHGPSATPNSLLVSPPSLVRQA